jgi:magnesium transporter
MLNGLLLAILSFGFVLLYLKLANKGVKVDTTFELFNAMKGAGIVGVSLLIAMTVSSFIGTIVPIIFLKIKIDPAVASGPFITTINDVTALLIYYGLAALLLANAM